MSSVGSHAEYGDAERRAGQYNAALQGGMKGAALGASFAFPAAYLLHQRWQPFRALPLPLKSFFVTSATIAAGVIAADKSGIAFDQEHYTDEGAKRLKQYRTQEDQEWAELSTADKALTWSKDNKFSIVAGSWVTSMAGIFAYIHNQPMSFSQKLVQTRVWAQGLTLGSLLAMAAITQIPSAGDKILKHREEAADHSWREFMGDSNAVPGGGGGSKKSSSSSSSSDSDNKSNGSKNNKKLASASTKTDPKALSSQEDGKGEADPSQKSSRSAHPTEQKQKAQTEKAPVSQTGRKAGYGGDN